jgi:hypothetical protein
MTVAVNGWHYVKTEQHRCPCETVAVSIQAYRETIFDQEILYGHTFSFDGLRDFLSLPAKAKRIVEALRGCDSKRWALSKAEAPYSAGSHTASV